MTEAPKHTCSEVDVLKLAFAKENYEIDQILGKALGYPKYSDDAKNFPNCDNDDVCTGEHVPVTLAMEAAQRIATLESASKHTCSERENYLKAINKLKAAINIARPHLVPSRRAEVDFYVAEADKTLEGL